MNKNSKIRIDLNPCPCLQPDARRCYGLAKVYQHLDDRPVPQQGPDSLIGIAQVKSITWGPCTPVFQPNPWSPQIREAVGGEVSYLGLVISTFLIFPDFNRPFIVACTTGKNRSGTVDRTVRCFGFYLHLRGSPAHATILYYSHSRWCCIRRRNNELNRYS